MVTSIELGNLSDPLSSQLHGIVPAETLVEFQADADALTRVHLRGLLTEREVLRARGRLLQKIKVHVEEHQRS